MSDSDKRRTFAVALGGIVAVAAIIFTVLGYRHFSEYRREQAQERQGASNDYRRDAEKHIEFCIEAIAEERLSDRLECLSQAIDAAEESATAKHDLKAQQDMSAWALGVLYVSMAALIATAIGVVFVWLTLRETRRIGQAQVRAYLQFEPVNVNYLPAMAGDGITISGPLTNRGQSPAIDVEIGGLVDTIKPVIADALDPRIVMMPIGSYLAPNLRMETVSVTIPFADFIADDSDSPLWCLVVVRSKDVFGKTQYAYFRSRFIERDGTPLTAISLVFAAGDNNVALANV